MIHLTTIQLDIQDSDAEYNLNQIEHLLSGVVDTDVVLLPETVSTGFMPAALPSPTEQAMVVERLKTWASSLDACICGSIAYLEDGRWYNRLLWITPKGHCQTYDKRHLFCLGQEKKYFSPGQEKIMVSWKDISFLPLICYDLRFPVWSRNTSRYDVLFYLANWPSARQHAWETLLMARAIENQSFVIGVNRVGRDYQNITYTGGTQIIDPSGKIIYRAQDHKEEVHTETLDIELLRRYRSMYPFLDDQDSFKILDS